ncbi:MAG: NAD-dependent succinate-semialdehyde dehydrogenase [Pseudomonadota bacterium]
MAYETIELLIDGELRKGDGGGEDIINPATGEVIGTCPHASAAELDMALAAAANGFQAWRATSPLARQKVMEGAARILEDRIDAVAETLTREQGKPFPESKLEVGFVIDMFRWYGEEGKRAYGRLVPSRVPGARQMVMKEPVGPVAAFVAWNFPGTNVIRKIAGAIGAGCSIIIKPSEETPGTAVAIARALQDAGLPDGVLNMVFGVPDTVSRHILASPVCKKLSFTGSIPVGKHLQKLAADTLKRCTMELGGHAPVVVFDDADVDKAVKVMAGFKFRNAGQVCVSPTRFFVQENVYSKFVDSFTEVAAAMKVGNGMDDGVQMGPLIADRRLEVMESFVSDAVSHGAVLKHGGARLGNVGSFWTPTVLADTPDDAMIMREEPFGPLAPITPFKGVDDVLERANALPFGLASYVWTGDGAKARTISEELEAGMVAVNHPAVSTPETPFGGVNESGYGSEGGTEGLEAYYRTKFVTEVGV